MINSLEYMSKDKLEKFMSKEEILRTALRGLRCLILEQAAGYNGYYKYLLDTVDELLIEHKADPSRDEWFYQYMLLQKRIQNG